MTSYPYQFSLLIFVISYQFSNIKACQYRRRKENDVEKCGVTWNNNYKNIRQMKACERQKKFLQVLIKTLIFCNECSSHMPSNFISLILFLPPPLVQFLCLISEDLSKISISHIQSWSSNSTSR